MTKYGITGILALSGLLLAGCQGKPDKGARGADAFFFDLSGYLKQEIARLEQDQPSGTKRVQFDEQTDASAFQRLNYSEELAPFLDADINKVSWRDKYRADTTLQQDGQIQSIRYTALEKNLKTRELTVRYAEGQLSDIEIRYLLKSIIAESEQHMRYRPGKGFSIEGKQGMRLASTHAMRVEVVFD